MQAKKMFKMKKFTNLGGPRSPGSGISTALVNKPVSAVNLGRGSLVGFYSTWTGQSFPLVNGFANQRPKGKLNCFAESSLWLMTKGAASLALPSYQRPGWFLRFSSVKTKKQRLKSQNSSVNSFFNITFDKGRLKNLVSWTLENYGQYKTVELLEQLKKTGFEYATKAGISLGIDDLKIPPKKTLLLLEAEQLTKLTVHQYQRADITAVERFQRLIDTWHRTSEQLKQEVISYFEETDILNPVYMMAFSGARGNISQVRQLVGMRGLMSNPQGQIIDFPIRSNFREGLTLTEYIISSYGARKGIVDTALRTANAGYLTRRLVDVAQHVIISHYDCGTQKGIFLTDMKEGNKILVSAHTRIIGRVLARDIYKPNTNILIASRNQEISNDLAFEITKITNKIFVRSSLTCSAAKLLCQLCYGWSLAQGNLVSVGETVGVIAAQSIGEPGTQLTMRTFHTGGVFSGDVSDEIRAPYNGFVEYSHSIPGILIRALDGKILFLTKSDGMLIFSSQLSTAWVPYQDYFFLAKGEVVPASKHNHQDNKITSLNSQETNNQTIKKYKIPAYTVLFVRNGESVFQKQVIAQITSIATKPNMRDTAELVINSELEGLFYSKTLQIQKAIIGPKPKFIGKYKQNLVLDPRAMEIVVKARGWNFAWVLSGKRYEIPLLLNIFPNKGDLITSKTVITRHNLYLGKLATVSKESFGYHSTHNFTIKKHQYNVLANIKLKKANTFYSSKLGALRSNTHAPRFCSPRLPGVSAKAQKTYLTQEGDKGRYSIERSLFSKSNKVNQPAMPLLPREAQKGIIGLRCISAQKQDQFITVKQNVLGLNLQKIRFHRIGYFSFFNTNLVHKNINNFVLNLKKSPTKVSTFAESIFNYNLVFASSLWSTKGRGLPFRHLVFEPYGEKRIFVESKAAQANLDFLFTPTSLNTRNRNSPWPSLTNRVNKGIQKPNSRFASITLKRFQSLNFLFELFSNKRAFISAYIFNDVLVCKSSFITTLSFKQKDPNFLWSPRLPGCPTQLVTKGKTTNNCASKAKSSVNALLAKSFSGFRKTEGQVEKQTLINYKLFLLQKTLKIYKTLYYTKQNNTYLNEIKHPFVLRHMPYKQETNLQALAFKIWFKTNGKDILKKEQIKLNVKIDKYLTNLTSPIKTFATNKKTHKIFSNLGTLRYTGRGIVNYFVNNLAKINKTSFTLTSWPTWGPLDPVFPLVDQRQVGASNAAPFEQLNFKSSTGPLKSEGQVGKQTKNYVLTRDFSKSSYGTNLREILKFNSAIEHQNTSSKNIKSFYKIKIPKLTNQFSGNKQILKHFKTFNMCLSLRVKSTLNQLIFFNGIGSAYRAYPSEGASRMQLSSSWPQAYGNWLEAKQLKLVTKKGSQQSMAKAKVSSRKTEIKKKKLSLPNNVPKKVKVTTKNLIYIYSYYLLKKAKSGLFYSIVRWTNYFGALPKLGNNSPGNIYFAYWATLFKSNLLNTFSFYIYYKFDLCNLQSRFSASHLSYPILDSGPSKKIKQNKTASSPCQQIINKVKLPTWPTWGPLDPVFPLVDQRQVGASNAAPLVESSLWLMTKGQREDGPRDVASLGAKQYLVGNKQLKYFPVQTQLSKKPSWVKSTQHACTQVKTSCLFVLIPTMPVVSSTTSPCGTCWSSNQEHPLLSQLKITNITTKLNNINLIQTKTWVYKIISKQTNVKKLKDAFLTPGILNLNNILSPTGNFVYTTKTYLKDLNTIQRILKLQKFKKEFKWIKNKNPRFFPSNDLILAKDPPLPKQNHTDKNFKINTQEITFGVLKTIHQEYQKITLFQKLTKILKVKYLSFTKLNLLQKQQVIKRVTLPTWQTKQQVRGPANGTLVGDRVTNLGAPRSPGRGKQRSSSDSKDLGQVGTRQTTGYHVTESCNKKFFKLNLKTLKTNKIKAPSGLMHEFGFSNLRLKVTYFKRLFHATYTRKGRCSKDLKRNIYLKSKNKKSFLNKISNLVPKQKKDLNLLAKNPKYALIINNYDIHKRFKSMKKIKTNKKNKWQLFFNNLFHSKQENYVVPTWPLVSCFANQRSNEVTPTCNAGWHNKISFYPSVKNYFISNAALSSKENKINNKNKQKLYKMFSKKMVSYNKQPFFDVLFNTPFYKYKYNAQTYSFINKKVLKIPRQPCVNLYFSSFKSLMYKPTKNVKNINLLEILGDTPSTPTGKKKVVINHILQNSNKLIAQTNYYAPFEGELLVMKPPTNFVDLNPYQNVQTGLIFLNTGFAGNQEKKRAAMFKYYLKTVTKQKILKKSTLTWRPLDLAYLGKIPKLTAPKEKLLKSKKALFNLILTKKDLLTLTYNKKIEKNYKNLLLNKMFEQNLKNQIHFKTLAELNKETSFNKAYNFNFKNQWLNQKINSLLFQIQGTKESKKFKIKLRIPLNALKTTKQIKSELFHNVYVLFFIPTTTLSFNSFYMNVFKQKKFLTKNKIGFFVLKGNTFLNSSTKNFFPLGKGFAPHVSKKKRIATSSSILYGDSSFLQDTRYINLKNVLILKKLHINQNSLTLKPLFDKLSFIGEFRLPGWQKKMLVYLFFIDYQNQENIVENLLPISTQLVDRIASPTWPTPFTGVGASNAAPLVESSLWLMTKGQREDEAKQHNKFSASLLTSFSATQLPTWGPGKGPLSSNTAPVHSEYAQDTSRKKIKFLLPSKFLIEQSYCVSYLSIIFTKQNTLKNKQKNYLRYNNKLKSRVPLTDSQVRYGIFKSSYNPSRCNFPFAYLSERIQLLTIVQSQGHNKLQVGISKQGDYLLLNIFKFCNKNDFVFLKPFQGNFFVYVNKATFFYNTLRFPFLGSLGLYKDIHYKLFSSSEGLSRALRGIYPQVDTRGVAHPLPTTQVGKNKIEFSFTTQLTTVLNFIKTFNGVNDLKFKSHLLNNSLCPSKGEEQNVELCSSGLQKLGVKTKQKTNPFFLVIKKSGQLIHMNQNKITIRLGQPLVISPRSIIHASHGDFIRYKTAVITLTYQQLKTGDIVQGIPKIEQLFEARTTKRGRLFRDNVTNLLTGLFLNYFVKSTYLLRKNMLIKLNLNSLSKPKGKTNDLSLSPGPNFTLSSQFVTNKQNQTIILAKALHWSVKQSFYKIQQIIVDGILRVYRSQGVSIADKHVEIIVKQMTSKVRIINSNASKMTDYSFSLQNIKRGLSIDIKTFNSTNLTQPTSPGRELKAVVFPLVNGQRSDQRSQVQRENKLLEKLLSNKLDGPTGLFPGEIVDIDFVENINIFLLKTASLESLNTLSTDSKSANYYQTSFSIEPIKYEPIVLGITRASLEVESFLSAASFQQTTRVLSQAALYKKKDFLKGLKENIIIGNLIPAGTGYLSSLNF